MVTVIIPTLNELPTISHIARLVKKAPEVTEIPISVFIIAL
jgi:hypothetical protein